MCAVCAHQIQLSVYNSLCYYPRQILYYHITKKIITFFKLPASIDKIQSSELCKGYNDKKRTRSPTKMSTIDVDNNYFIFFFFEFFEQNGKFGKGHFTKASKRKENHSVS